MTRYFLALILALTTVNAYADIQGAPFLPEEDKRFDALEQGNHIKQGSYPQGAADGHWLRQLAQATYDFSVFGGSSVVNGGIQDLGVSLPANAIVTRSYLYSITQPATSSSATIGFYCNNAANPEFKLQTAAASYAADGALVDGIQTGSAANMSVISSACNVKSKIETGNMTAGKVTLYLEYVVHQ